MSKNTFLDKFADPRFSALRKEYAQKSLCENEVAADPVEQCERWLGEAAQRGLTEPNAMVLATVSPEGQPSARTVLLKGLDQRGLVFFSNYTSRKGREIAGNSRVALLFLWAELERQIRVEGVAERLPESESDRYFAARPRGAQLSAHASEQSAPIADRGLLETRMSDLESRYGEGTIPRPQEWGGYLVVPASFEFWQGRRNRLHDRLVYTRGAGTWSISRIQP
ncbi:MAG: hypothetical protein RL417_1802 [Pseudomonadota bacterium]|jgi:pyridoxamine 5'-phosphate oxidase